MKFEVALDEARSVNHTVQAGLMPNLDSFDPDEMLLLLGSGVVCVFGFFHWVRRLQSVSNLGCHPLHRTVSPASPRVRAGDPVGLRRHRLGGFGGFVPEPSAG